MQFIINIFNVSCTFMMELEWNSLPFNSQQNSTEFVSAVLDNAGDVFPTPSRLADSAWC